MLASAQAEPVRVVVEKIDGSTFTARWLGVTTGETVSVKTREGTISLALDEVAGVTFRAVDARDDQPFGEPVAASGPQDTDEGKTSTKVVLPTADTSIVSGPAGSHHLENPLPMSASGEETPDAVRAVFYLADGGMVPGMLLAAPDGDDAVLTRSVLGDRVLMPFDQLAALRLARGPALRKAETLFQQSLASRLPGEDIVITRDVDQPKRLRGRLESLGASSGRFYFAKRSRSFQTSRLLGLVLASGAGGFDRSRFPVTFTLSDGSTFSGRLVKADDEGVSAVVSVGVSVELPIARLASLRMFSDRIVYVSDLTPTETRTEGLLHQPWPVQFDRNVSHGPLSMDGRVFAKGLGVHSKTTLTFALDRAYETLAGVIGLDDAVRPRGSVVFRVRGDGKTLFDSGPVTGRDKPRKIIVDLKATRTLTLEVDYGPDVDLSDQADWAELRLIKP